MFSKAKIYALKSLHNKIFSMGKSLHEDKDFCNFAFNKTIVCRAAYARHLRCIRANAALQTRDSCPAGNIFDEFEIFDKIKWFLENYTSILQAGDSKLLKMSSWQSVATKDLAVDSANLERETCAGSLSTLGMTPPR